MDGIHQLPTVLFPRKRKGGMKSYNIVHVCNFCSYAYSVHVFTLLHLMCNFIPLGTTKMGLYSVQYHSQSNSLSLKILLTLCFEEIRTKLVHRQMTVYKLNDEIYPEGSHQRLFCIYCMYVRKMFGIFEITRHVE